MITSDEARIASLTSLGAWGELTLHELLAARVEERGDALAVVDQANCQDWFGRKAVQLSFKELDQASDSMAAAFLNVGLVRDDCLIVQLPNVAELFVCYHAASKIGLIVSPIPVQYGAHELRHIAKTVSASAVLTCECFKSTALASNAEAALPNTKIICCGRELPPIGEMVKASPESRRQVRDHQLLNPSTANDIITICWTSGTTGTPKGVPRSHNMWLATGRATAAAGEYQNGDRLLVPFPLVNMAALGGFLFPAAIFGATIVLHHPFDAAMYLQQLADEAVNFSVAPPAVLNQLAKSPELWQQHDFLALRALGSGSAPLAPWMVKKFEQDYKLTIINFYGSNEGVSLHSTPHTAPDPEARGTMFPRIGIAGLPWESLRPGVLTKIADPETGEEITSVGVSGELLMAGPTVFDGYFDHDNEGVFSEDGFFRSGDLVEICGEPPLYPQYRIVGRCKDIINRGGMKISPVELDLLIDNYPGVAEAAVCAYADERLGEKICACLVMQKNVPAPELNSIQAWLLDQGLAKFKLPEQIVIVKELPRNPLGKVQRFALSDQLRDKVSSS
ncbi:MAG: class I adenylate-forming enzyme family protein [Pseudomonadales bacterium]